MEFGKIGTCKDILAGPREAPFAYLSAAEKADWLTRELELSSGYPFHGGLLSSQFIASETSKSGCELLENVMKSLDQTFLDSFPTLVDEYGSTGFRDYILERLENPGFLHFATYFNLGSDLDMISFLWQIYRNDIPRIRDFFHNHVWLPDGTHRDVNSEGTWYHFNKIDGFPNNERAIVRDFVKHIRWSFDKQYDQIHLTLFGASNLPTRHYDMIPSIVTIFDPRASIPKNDLVFDPIPRRNTEIFKEDFRKATNHVNLQGTQSAVFFDHTAFLMEGNKDLVEAIVTAASLLCHHGRFYFDLPISADCTSRMETVIGFRPVPPGYSPEAENVGEAIETVRRVVAEANNRLREKHCIFIVEDLRATDLGPWGVTSLRVFLNKIVTKML